MEVSRLYVSSGANDNANPKVKHHARPNRDRGQFAVCDTGGSVSQFNMPPLTSANEGHS